MDIDHLLQYLIPGIFLIIWVIGRIFSPKRPEEAESQDTAKGAPEGVDESFEEIFGLDTEEEERRSVPKPKQSISQGVRMMPPVNRYVGDSSSRIQDINTLSKQSILNEIGSEDLRKTKQHSEVRSLLEGRHALRKGFLTCEILGPPLALRKGGKIGRSWQR